MRNSPRQSAIANAVAKVKSVFFCIYLDNIFAKVIALKKNTLISREIFSYYLYTYYKVSS